MCANLIHHLKLHWQLFGGVAWALSTVKEQNESEIILWTLDGYLKEVLQMTNNHSVFMPTLILNFGILSSLSERPIQNPCKHLRWRSLQQKPLTIIVKLSILHIYRGPSDTFVVQCKLVQRTNYFVSALNLTFQEFHYRQNNTKNEAKFHKIKN